jgi:uncharacterized membrane protein
MNKKEFLKKLKRLLPANDQKEIIADYEEHFNTGISEGKTEEEIASDLGTPTDVAKEFGYVREKAPVRNVVFAAIGLILFDALIGIAIVASVFSVWISLWSVAFSLLVSGVALIVSIFFTALISPFPWYLGLISGIALLGLSGLFSIGMIYVTKYFFKALRWYGDLHVRIFANK